MADPNAYMTVGSAALGSVMQELVYWFNLRRRLDQARYSKLVGSAPYWIVVALMIVGAGLTSLVWFYGPAWPAPKDAFTFGIGLPLLIKQLGSVGAGNVKFGAKSKLATYFQGA